MKTIEKGKRSPLVTQMPGSEFRRTVTDLVRGPDAPDASCVLGFPSIVTTHKRGGSDWLAEECRQEEQVAISVRRNEHVCPFQTEAWFKSNFYIELFMP